MPMSKNNAAIAVRVPKEFKAELEQLAKQEKRSLSNYITIVLEEHMKQKQAQSKENNS